MPATPPNDPPIPDPPRPQRPRADTIAAGATLAPVSVAGDYARLAAVAHDFWCRRMSEAGWRPGAEFDPSRRTHDAMVPFDRLEPDDQWAAVEILESLGAGPRLAEPIVYPRGLDAPLRARDMVVGLAVESGDRDQTTGRPVPGSVISWTTRQRTGRLDSVTVRWADGQVTSHTALAGEVRRALPPPSLP